ncbi:MAG: M1 family aminopeptidase [Bacteroidota bacterium]
MFTAIFNFECSTLLRQWSTYFYAFAFASLTFLSMIGTGGFFDGVEATTTPQRWLNSPYELSYILLYFNKVMLFLAPAIIGMRLYQDTATGLYKVLYAYPIHKREYLWAKFAGPFAITVGIVLLVLLAVVAGEWLLGIENPKVGPTNGWGYLQVLFVFLLPNFLIFGSIVFAVVGWSRSIFAGFGAVLLFFLWQLIVENVLLHQPFAVAMLDPFGQNALQYATRTWTLDAQNTQLLPVWGAVGLNRLVWLSVSAVIAWIFGRQFQLQTSPLISWGEKSRVLPNRPTSKDRKGALNRSIRYDFSLLQQMRTLLRLAWVDAQYILRSGLFVALLGFGVAAILFAIVRVTNNGDIALLPLTRLMLSVPLLFFTAIIILMTFVFGGLLVHRARMANSSQLIDVTPTPNWVLMGSKVGALVLTQMALLLVLIGCGISIQLFNGYDHLELDLYFFQLFVLVLPMLVVWAVTTVVAHTFIPNLYLGIFLLLMLWLGKDQLHYIGLDTCLLQFNTTPELRYSDLNGFGSRLWGVYLVQGYWLVVALLLGMLGYIFWRRGFTFGWRDYLAKRPTGMSFWVVVLAAMVALSGLGARIYQAEQASTFHESDLKKSFRTFQEKYAHLRQLPQPKIQDMELALDLFPERETFTAKGRYTLVNTTGQVIDTILIKTGFDEQTEVRFGKTANQIAVDSSMKFEVYELAQSLAPGDSMALSFSIQSTPNTLFAQNSPVFQNGTFMKTDILPRIGYFYEKIQRAATDSLARHQNFYSLDADTIQSNITMSTSANQRAFAPGQLQKEWQADGRNYFHYQTQVPIKFVLAFLSGEYDTQKTTHKGTALTIHHHPTHAANNNQMLDGLKAAIDYNTQYFSPLAESSIDIVEFPHTLGSYASLMGNLIPSSALNFTLNSARAAEKIDLAFYVSAHELTHHWWGNQLVPARALGAKMLTESITEYITLQIFKRYYGSKKARDFLSIQHQRYFRGRRNAVVEEPPLAAVRDEQEYIAYGKGTIALNALKHLWGEAELNGFLQTFLEAYPSSQGIYPTTTDFLRMLREQLPEDLQYLIEDYFESVSFHDARITSVKKVQNRMQLELTAKKWCEEQKEVVMPLDGWVQIAFYDKSDAFLKLETVRLTTTQPTIQFPLIENAVKAVIDPNHLLLDRKKNDNQYIFDF